VKEREPGMDQKKARVLVGRFTLDGHDRGILTVIHALRNAGMEVIYTHFSNPKEIARSAVQEDVDVIGITSSMGEHLMICSLLLEELRKEKATIPVIVGGVIPSSEIPVLLDLGVKKVFGPGSTPAEAVAFAAQLAREKDQA
jgi:methylmalonyl-CoA mutase C-terminal domain/subunit